MPRKPVREMSAEELESYRTYMREAKRKSRANKPTEKDNRKAEHRREYFREQKRRKRKELTEKNKHRRMMKL